MTDLDWIAWTGILGMGLAVVFIALIWMWGRDEPRDVPGHWPLILRQKRRKDRLDP